MEFMSGNKRTWNDFESQIPLEVKPTFEEFRNFCLSLGDNVVEDVRMHRIVFGKTMSFRWFADIEPEKQGVLIKIQKDRKEPPETIQVKSTNNTEQTKELIKKAYQTIH